MSALNCAVRATAITTVTRIWMATALTVTHNLCRQGALQLDTNITIATILTPMMRPTGTWPGRDNRGVTGRHRVAQYGPEETFNSTTQG